jgi:hypothetical protein
MLSNTIGSRRGLRAVLRASGRTGALRKNPSPRDCNVWLVNSASGEAAGSGRRGREWGDGLLVTRVLARRCRCRRGAARGSSAEFSSGADTAITSVPS